MSPRLKSLVPLIALLALVALWSFESPRGWKPPATTQVISVSHPAPRSDEPLPTVVPKTVPSGKRGRQRVLTPGLEHRYAFDLDVRSAEHIPGAETGRNWRHNGWSGVLELAYLGVEGGQHFFSARVEATRVEAEKSLSEEALSAFRSQLERPSYVAQDSRGRVLAVHFEEGLETGARRFLRLLLAATQFVAEDGRSWSTEETDPTGDYESEYRAGGSANTYVKTKRRYLRTALPLWAPTGPRGPGVVVPRLRGHLDFMLDEDGLVREVAGSDVVEQGGRETGLPQTRAETRVALTRLETPRHTSLSMRMFREARGRLHAEPLTGLATPRVGAAAVEWDRRLVGEATLDVLLRVLETETREQERIQARERLAALFRLLPAKAGLAARRVRQGAVKDGVVAQVMEALGSAGTPESQRELARLLGESRLRVTTRAWAATAAGKVAQPSAELTQALARAVGATKEGELRHAVGLALGSMVKGMERSEPGRALGVLDGLMGRCEAKRLDAETCLRALARAGSSRGLEYTRTALSHRSAEVRVAATEALGAMAGADVDVLLDRVLLEDPEVRVRAQAAVMISRRVAGPHLRAAAQSLRMETEPQVRAEVVRMLGTLLTVEHLAGELLRDVVARDDSEEVRRLASSFLAE
ncbi:HEAT repeat domain-containing protein [Corallococcus terminator]